MGLEEDLRDVRDTVDEHGNRIGKLETDVEVFKEKFNNVTTQLTRIENSSLTSNNALLASNASILQTMNKVIEGNTTQDTNKKNIIMNVVKIGGSIIGLVILGYFAMKGVSVRIPLF